MSDRLEVCGIIWSATGYFLNPETGERIGDAVCHFGSYGHERGLIEVMGFPFCDEEDVVGFLTADEVIHQIEECC